MITQWFERARFEWHPDKPREFWVLLGLVGNEVQYSTATDPVGISFNVIRTFYTALYDGRNDTSAQQYGQSYFPATVRVGADSRYRVLELPPYAP